ncbi:MAG: oligosaccharide flippase family protein [archaeon]
MVLKEILKTLIEKIRKDSLYRNSFYIMLSTVIMTGFGFFFWTINARLFSSEQIGLATTIISAMSLLTSLAGLGMGTALVRFLPTAEDKNKKINTCLTVNFFISIIVSTIFLQGILIFSPKLSFIQKNLYFAIAFIAIVAFQGLFSMLDSVFTAYRKNEFTVIKNSVFSMLKLAFPFIFIGLGAFGIFAAWGASSIIAFIVGIILLAFNKKYVFRYVIYDDILKKIGSYSFANYISGFVSAVPALIMPMMITNLLDPEYTAYYYVAMMIAGLLFTIPSSIASSLFAEGSSHEKDLNSILRRSFRLIYMLLLPGVIVMLVLGRYILLFFGHEYTAGASLLGILALSSIVIAIKSVYFTVLNIKKRVAKIILINLLISSMTIGMSYFSITHGYGLEGIGYSWLISNAMIIPFAFWMIWRNVVTMIIPETKGKSKAGKKKKRK